MKPKKKSIEKIYQSKNNKNKKNKDQIWYKKIKTNHKKN